MKLTVFIFLILSIVSLQSKDIVVTKDGNIYKGKIEKYDEKELIIKLTENNTFKIPSENILTVDYDNNLKEEPKEFKKYNHALGLSVFFPTDYNIDYNLILKDIIAELSIGHDFENLYGIEIGLKHPFYFNKDIYLAPNFIIGYQYYDFDLNYPNDFYTSLNSRTYFSAALNFNLYGFNAKFGFLLIDTGYFRYNRFIDEPLYLKVGYMYHF